MRRINIIMHVLECMSCKYACDGCGHGRIS